MKNTESLATFPRQIVVDTSHDGQRLDNFLLTRLKGLPRFRVYRIIRRGEVRINSRRARPDTRLAVGDKVRIPPVRLGPEKCRPILSESLRNVLERAILYEDEYLLVLDKPAGLAVHGGTGLVFGIIEAYRAMRPQIPFLELVHRLDRETSGLLLLAKSRPMLLELHQLLREGGLHKEYLTLLCGSWQDGEQVVDVPLERQGSRYGRHTVRATTAVGKIAISQFIPVQFYGGHTLMRVIIGTGRTHQIRVHAASIGYPVVGDRKYGNFNLNRQACARGLKRQFLHAHTLRFVLPSTRRKYHFQAPLPVELQGFLDQFDDKYLR